MKETEGGADPPGADLKASLGVVEFKGVGGIEMVVVVVVVVGAGKLMDIGTGSSGRSGIWPSVGVGASPKEDFEVVVMTRLEVGLTTLVGSGIGVKS